MTLLSALCVHSIICTFWVKLVITHFSSYRWGQLHPSVFSCCLSFVLFDFLGKGCHPHFLLWVVLTMVNCLGDFHFSYWHKLLCAHTLSITVLSQTSCSSGQKKVGSSWMYYTEFEPLHQVVSCTVVLFKIRLQLW